MQAKHMLVSDGDHTTSSILYYTFFCSPLFLHNLYNLPLKCLKVNTTNGRVRKKQGSK